MSLRDLILGSDDMKPEVMEVPEWGVTIAVRPMTGTERSDFVNAIRENGDVPYGSMLWPLILDPDTYEQVFTPKDAEELDKKNGVVLERISRTAMKLSGMGPEAVKEAAARFPD